MEKIFDQILSKKFNKNQLVQNIIARELIPHLEKARITCLANDEDEFCRVSSYSFQVCEIGPTETKIYWKDPSSCGKIKELAYNMYGPSFDPDFLIKTITQFSKRIVEIKNDLDRAWKETEDLWRKNE